MILYLFAFLCLFELSNSAKISNTKTSTKTSTRSFIKFRNNLDDLYMKESFDIDKCKTFSNRRQYVTLLLKKNIACRGHCYMNSYMYNSIENYQAEHIIDLQNSILEGCNKNIYGNLVMAYGRWNQEIGQLEWKDAEKEKRLVYKNLFDKAIYNIKLCDPNCKHETLSDSDMPYISILAVYFIVIVINIIRYCIDSLE